MEYQVIHQADLPLTNGVPVCEGCHLGEAHVSLLLVDAPPGRGPRLHRHPYKEIFVVHSGQARFTIGSAVIDIVGGQVVVVEAGIAHKFENSGEERLLQTDIHLSAACVTEWLES
jgi:mannose-6-phosphate isomerase-like protein (cupin superfamily)